MRRDRYSKKHNNNWKNNSSNRREKQEEPKPVFHATIKTVSAQTIQQDELAIKEFKSSTQITCPLCGQSINELSTAVTDAATGSTVHFDCAIEKLKKSETLEQNDKIIYIGQGRFGVVHFDNIHDTKHFNIKKIIDFESKEKKEVWREEMSDLYSKIK